jgi:nicotinate-nucleotide--dimethylbenzimidazole phosphoribosyltransferase
MMLEQTIKQIQPISESWLNRAKERLDNLTKPKGSLGVLEKIAARVVAIREEERPSVNKKGVFVFAGDHEVVSEGISAYPQEVTGLMVKNLLNGGAGINVLARSAGANVSIIDIGMKEDIPNAQGLIKKNVGRGAHNITKGPAMTVEEAEKAINVGIEMAETAFSQRTTMIATGEMGIGNTTPSSALLSALLPADVIDVTGRGTGLDDEGLRNKVKVIKKALEVNKRHLWIMFRRRCPPHDCCG